MYGKHTSQSSRNAYCETTFCTEAFYHVTFFVQIHIVGCGARSHLPVIDSAIIAIFSTIHHKTATTQTSCKRIGNIKSEVCSNHCIKHIPALLHNFRPNARCFFSGRDDHGFLGDKAYFWFWFWGFLITSYKKDGAKKQRKIFHKKVLRAFKDK